MTRAFRASLVLALLSAACTPEEKPPEPPPAVDPCAGLPPLSLTANPTKVRVKDPVSLTATGGSGYYRYRVEPGGSSGEMRGSRFVAGATPSTDTLVVEDQRCPGDARAQVSVVAAFDVAPGRAMLKQGTSFQVQVSGLLGNPVFTLVSSNAGSTVSPSGVYTAGTGQGLDLVSVRDDRSGDEALLQFEVRSDAVLRGDPELLAVPSGSSVALATVGGSDRIAWTKVSGPGSLDSGRFVAEAGASGTALLKATDPFTNQTATVSVRVLSELARDTVAHGQLTDTASVVTADFDGDGVPDVAVGRPESDLNRPQGGVVLIFKGSAAGLPAQPTWTLAGETDTARFGDSLVAGDLDKDGKAELVISSPGADVTIDSSGAVYLYRFGTNGPERIRPPLAGVGRGAFGTGVDLRDVDGDGDLDLIVGSPAGDLAATSSISSRGIVDIFQLTPGQPVPDLPTVRLGGSDIGLTGNIEQRSRTGIGQAVLVADFNKDGRPDVAALGKASRYKADNTSLGVVQPAVSVFFGRADAPLFRATPDVFVLPTNTADSNEGTWKLGMVPAEGARPPLLMVVMDRADSPDLRTSGGVAAATDAGGAFLFDLTTFAVAGEPADTPPQVKISDAFARFYGDAGSIVAGRGFALADVDATPGLELLLGAPYASIPSGTTSLRYGGKVLVFPLTGLTKGAAFNKPQSFLPGLAKSDAFGAGIAPWALPGSGGLVAFAARASGTGLAFTGRVDAFVKGGDSLAQWTRSSFLVPAKPSVERFGEAVAVGKGTAGVVALVGSPGWAGPGVNADGNDLSAGRAYTYGAAGGTGTLVGEGMSSPLYNGRNVGTDVAFTDFNGDGKADLVIGAPAFTIPRATAAASELGNAYVVKTECLPTADTGAGGVLVSLAQADGSYKPAYRLWALGNVTDNCIASSGTCTRSGIGRGVVGGFDFNGDGKQDIGALRNNGFELWLGRAPDDATLAKLTMGCDPGYSSPYFATSSTTAQTTSVPVALGDLNADGCDEVAWRYSDGSTRSGIAVLFGFDKGGTRCGGRTSASVVRLAADPEVGNNFLGFGVATARVGRVLGKTGADYLAVSASSVPYDGVTQPAVMLFDTAELVKRRPASGEAVAGALEQALYPKVLVHRSRAVGFGTALAGGVDLTGDGVPELVVSAPGASVASDGGGAVFIYAGGPAMTGALTPMLTLTGDTAERSGFGQDLALVAGGSGSPPTLVVGAPLSYRTGTQNGTAFVVPLGF